MARTAQTLKTNTPETVTNQRGYWADEIAKGEKRYSTFVTRGNNVQDRYRLEKDDTGATDLYQDRYNILYSSTETTKPSLYAMTPRVQATKRHKDRENQYVTLATMLLESAGQYALEEVDFDGVMKNVVQDYLLPGMGIAWVRYAPVFRMRKGANDNSEGEGEEELAAEGLDVDYVHYKDFITGVGRVWKELPWIARRVYFDKTRAEKRFGKEKALKLSYSYRPTDDGNGNKDFAGAGGFQAIIWEIWDKVNRKVIWYSNDYSEDVLDSITDPLRLKDFWPCPEPIRAVYTTRTFIPKAFYSQYKAQAEELDNITERIRFLTQALRVIGVYDSSQTALSQLLQGKGNKLVPVENWTLFAQQGGIAGSIQYVPIKEVADVLMNLMQQRDIVKAEIYEITGFSDIVRGVSKASETLGAQKIKADWAGGRLRDMQKEVQRFCRDIIRIMSEIMSEHFSEANLALYAGFDPPEVTDEEQQAAAQYVVAMQQYQSSLTMPQMPGAPPAQPPQKPGPTARQQAIQTFQKTVQLLKSEKQRAASIGIETDSTIAPDEAAEREDRMTFLSSAGAFLQQAGPMALQYPDMRGLLGNILMFTIRTFRSSRPLEKAFEDFQKKLEAAPPQNPDGKEGGDDGAAAAQAQVQTETLKQQTAKDIAGINNATARYKIDKDAENKLALANIELQIKQAELAIKQAELALKQQELGIKKQEADADAVLAEQDQQHRHSMEEEGMRHEQNMDTVGVAQGEREFAAGREDTDRSFEQQEADREAAAKQKPA